MAMQSHGFHPVAPFMGINTRGDVQNRCMGSAVAIGTISGHDDIRVTRHRMARRGCQIEVRPTEDSTDL